MTQLDPKAELSPLLVGEILDRMSALPGTTADFEEDLIKIARGLRCSPDVIQVLCHRFAATATLIADPEVAHFVVSYRFGPEQERVSMRAALSILVATLPLRAECNDFNVGSRTFNFALSELMQQNSRAWSRSGADKS